VAGAEAPALGAEDDHAGGRVAVGLVEALHERLLELRADRVELVGSIQGDDADAAVRGVGDERRSHGGAPQQSDGIGITSAIRFLPETCTYSTRSAMAATSATPSPPTGRSSTPRLSSGTRTRPNGSKGRAVSSYVSVMEPGWIANARYTGASLSVPWPC